MNCTHCSERYEAGVVDGKRASTERIAELEALALDYSQQIHDKDTRVAELEADFHRIAEAVLGDIHEGEATANDVIKFVQATDKQYAELQDLVAAEPVACQSCGTLLSRECPTCKRLWES